MVLDLNSHPDQCKMQVQAFLLVHKSLSFQHPPQTEAAEMLYKDQREVPESEATQNKT